LGGWFAWFTLYKAEKKGVQGGWTVDMRPEDLKRWGGLVGIGCRLEKESREAKGRK